MSELKPSTMTDDERLKLITWLESRAQGSAMPGASRMYKLALDAIRAQPANEPLTMEELREMDGEPVYIKYHSCGRWEIYQRFMHDHGFYGKTWLAYRRPPERSENG